MSEDKEKLNPGAFIGSGVAFIGAGIALSVALMERTGPAVGIALIGLGVTFLILGLSQKKKLEAGESGEDDEQSPE